MPVWAKVLRLGWAGEEKWAGRARMGGHACGCTASRAQGSQCLAPPHAIHSCSRSTHRHCSVLYLGWRITGRCSSRPCANCGGARGWVEWATHQGGVREPGVGEPGMAACLEQQQQQRAWQRVFVPPSVSKGSFGEWTGRHRLCMPASRPCPPAPSPGTWRRSGRSPSPPRTGTARSAGVRVGIGKRRGQGLEGGT